METNTAKNLRTAILAAAHNSVVVNTPEGAAAAGDLLEAAIRYYITDLEFLEPLKDVDRLELGQQYCNGCDKVFAYGVVLCPECKEAEEALAATAGPVGLPDWKATQAGDAKEYAASRPVAEEEAGAEPAESDLERTAREHREAHNLPLRTLEGELIPEPEPEAGRRCAHCGTNPASYCGDCYALRYERTTAAGITHKAPSGYELLATRWAVPTSQPKEGYQTIDEIVSAFDGEGATFFVLERVKAEGDGVYRLYVYRGLE